MGSPNYRDLGFELLEKGMLRSKTATTRETAGGTAASLITD